MSMSLCCRRNTLPACLFYSDIWTSTSGGSGSRKGLASWWPQYKRFAMSVRIVTIFLPLALGATRQAAGCKAPPVFSVSRGLTPSQLGSITLSRQSPERGCTSPLVLAILQMHCLPSQYPSACSRWILI